ncbi:MULTISPECIES: phage portal protein [Comamonas]|uniref:phage portal protein n=1 Tax=Comamonas TaxID=283 RepID=UPI001EE743EF|nr:MULTISPECIES: phage portal protein [Comamonas]
MRWVSLDKYTGLSPIALHANSIGYALALEEYGSKSFLHGTALSGVLERPKEAAAIKEQSAIDALTNNWQAKFGGAPNAGKVALLQEGMTFKALSMNNVDAELIGALKLAAVDITRIYKMPPPMVGMMEAATYNNVENLQIQFVIYTLMPWLRRHEQALQRDLLLPSERSRYYIEFNIGGLLRGNQEARFKAYAVARQWGWLSVNDIRRLENLPPVTGGDVYLQPLNMVGAGTQMPEKLTEASDEQVRDIQKALT